MSRNNTTLIFALVKILTMLFFVLASRHLFPNGGFVFQSGIGSSQVVSRDHIIPRNFLNIYYGL